MSRKLLDVWQNKIQAKFICCSVWCEFVVGGCNWHLTLYPTFYRFSHLHSFYHSQYHWDMQWKHFPVTELWRGNIELGIMEYYDRHKFLTEFHVLTWHKAISGQAPRRVITFPISVCVIRILRSRIASVLLYVSWHAALCTAIFLTLTPYEEVRHPQ